jgi:hypothetical protein
MVRKGRGLAAVSALLFVTHGVLAQQLPPAPAPAAPGSAPAVAPASPPSNWPAPLPPPSAAPTIAPPALVPPPYTPYQDNNGPLLRGDPLIDRPQYPPPGWFAAVEVNILAPYIKNKLVAPVTFDHSVFPPIAPGVIIGPVSDVRSDLVHLPTAELQWVGAPRIDVGADGFLHSRLSANVLDLDYSSREFSLAPRWDMKWKVGVRLADIFFDSQAEDLFLEQRTSNLFYGIGPHVGLDLWRSLDVPGLALFLRTEGASVVGQVRQSFEETILTGVGTLIGGATEVHHTQAVPVLNIQAGLSWTPCWHGYWTRFALGYEFERWWYLGQAGDSRAELTDQGVFFRAEFRF